MYKDDAISREYCLDTIAKLPINWEYGLGVEDCYKIVENAPSIDGQVRNWISVEERLPEYFKSVLIYCPTHKNIYEVYLDTHGVWRFFNYGAGQVVDEHVTHWMPLPDMPKEDD